MSTLVEQHGERHDDSLDDQVADRVEETVEDHPWLERIMRLGWVSKGVVYALMGFIAVVIARSGRHEEDASPEGALSVVMESPGGRALLAVVAVGLVLYSAWRLFSMAVIRGGGIKEWLERIGYTFSGLFYGFLALTAARSLWNGHDPERSTAVERISRALLDTGVGRVLIVVGGLVVIGVGLYFAKTSLKRDFMEELKTSGCKPGERTTIEVSGVVGHLGRAFVTLMVGSFLLAASVTANPDEARGFDRSLRHLTGSGWGTAIVMATAVGLIVYGIFCLASVRHRELT